MSDEEISTYYRIDKPLLDFNAKSGKLSHKYLNLSYGANSVTGWRLSQQDRYDFLLAPQFMGQWSAFAVYDGHGGDDVAEYLRKNLISRIRAMQYNKMNIREAIHLAFEGMDREIKNMTEDVFNQLKASLIKSFPLPDCQPPTSAENNKIEDVLNDIKEQFVRGMLELQAKENKSDIEFKKKFAVKNKKENDAEPRRKVAKKSKVESPKCKTLSKSEEANASLQKKLLERRNDNEKPHSADSESEHPPCVDDKCMLRTEKDKEPLSDNELKKEFAVKNKKENDAELRRKVAKKSKVEFPKCKTLSKSEEANASLEKKLLERRNDNEKPHSADSESEHPPCVDDKCMLRTEKDKEPLSVTELRKDFAVKNKKENDAEPRRKVAKKLKVESPKCKTLSKSIEENACSQKFLFETRNDNKKHQLADSESEHPPCVDDKCMLRTEKDKDPLVGLYCGSTATVVVLTDDRICVGNVGDSRCIAYVNNKIVRLSTDHFPTLPVESERIIAAKHTIVNGRIDGAVNLSRAFGDFGLKDKFGAQAVIVEPYINDSIKLSNDLDFIIIASDGIWRYVTNIELVRFVKRKMNIPLTEVCAKVFDYVLSKSKDGTEFEGMDNMTMIIIKNDSKYKTDEKKL